MSSLSVSARDLAVQRPVDVDVVPALHHRNRLTCAFRIILAIPHMLLVGGPMAFAMTWFGSGEAEPPRRSLWIEPQGKTR